MGDPQAKGPAAGTDQPDAAKNGGDGKPHTADYGCDEHPKCDEQPADAAKEHGKDGGAGVR
jgi:hypothetical protein